MSLDLPLLASSLVICFAEASFSFLFFFFPPFPPLALPELESPSSALLAFTWPVASSSWAVNSSSSFVPMVPSLPPDLGLSLCASFALSFFFFFFFFFFLLFLFFFFFFLCDFDFGFDLTSFAVTSWASAGSIIICMCVCVCV